MLLRWVCIAFVLEHLQRINELGTCKTWLDDLVDVAASSSDVRISKLLSIFCGQLLAPCFGISGPINLILKQDIHRTLCTHHGNFCGGPGVVDITAYMLAVHHIIGTTIGFASDY